MIPVLIKLRKKFFHMRGYYRATIAGRPYRLDPYHSKFWRAAAAGAWEPHTFRLLDRYVLADTVYCDIGAWIGPTVLHAANRCRKVYCFEPDPVAFRYLNWNLELNDVRNVSAFNFALADRNGLARIASFGSHLGDSMSSLLPQDREQGVDVVSLTWDSACELISPEPIDVMKIDIEGGEFSLLPSMAHYLRQHKPVIFLSTHPQFIAGENREPCMRRVAELMQMYAHCFDRDMQPIELEQLTSGEALQRGKTFVFSD